MTLSLSAAVAQNVVIEGPPGVRLAEIAGTQTMVTVVLKGGGAKAPEDPNLRIVDVQDALFNVLTPSGDVIPYLFEDVALIRVQGGKVEKSRLNVGTSRALRAEDQEIVGRAWTRAAELYATSSNNQDLKMNAATLLVLQGDEAAQEYLERLAESNDLQTQLQAALALYLSGKEVSHSLVRQGLERSGNRRVRGLAASLAGLTAYHDAAPLLNTMLQDRAADLSAPAARALARLGNREIIPRLLVLIGENNTQKGDAAVFALTRLGGEDIIEQMKLRLEEADGMERFRMILVLYELGDPEGRKLLKWVFNEVPTLAPEAALLLAKEGDYDAGQYLRKRLEARKDPEYHNLVSKARDAASLFEGGNRQALAVFQELLRSDDAAVKMKVAQLLTTLGRRELLAIVQAGIEHVDPQTALSACMAAIAIAQPDFRERLMESWQ